MNNNIVSENVIKYFETLSLIPRNSGNEKGMQNYLVDFAISRNLPYFIDEYNNVIIYKKTCNKEPIILQAHTDMVCVKTPKSKHNFNKDAIKIIKKGDWLTAQHTTLGADDGIGVALILEILDTVTSCNIEAVFTASEETTMQGAYKLNVKKLSAKKMICLDGFQVNTILTSSASFTDFLVNFGTDRTFITNANNLKTFKLVISGLEGGHSGFDIDKNRGNSNILITELLNLIPDVTLNDFSGGLNYNILPSKTEVIFTTTTDNKTIKQIIKNFYIQNKKQYKTLKIQCHRQLNKTLVLQQSANLLGFINNFQQGVIKRNENNEVIASQNLSEISTDNGTIKIGLRSNVKTYEKEMLNNLRELCRKFKFEGKEIDTQPSFSTLNNSELLKALIQTNSNATEVKSHMAVECGIFQDRIKNLDIVIISPTIIDAHCTTERLNISSIAETSIWLKNFLETY